MKLLKEEVLETIHNQVVEQITFRIKNTTWRHVRFWVGNRIRLRVQYQIWEQVWEQLNNK